MAAFFKSVFLAGVEPLINRALQLDPNAKQLLEPLHNTTLAVALTDIGFEFTVIFNANAIALISAFEPTANTTLTAPLASLMRFAKEPTQAMKPLDIRISGDIRTLSPLMTLLQEVEPDWEEALASRIGDAAASQLSYWIRQLRRWSESSRQRVSLHAKTFFKQGDRHFVTNTELGAFFDHVDALNLDSERLELKIARLERTLSQQNRSSQARTRASSNADKKSNNADDRENAQ